MTEQDRPELGTIVEVRPEVTFLSELLQELTQGRLRIPRFQRPFVWRRDQMTDLLDSVYKQYPIGSLLVWETDLPIATLDKLGPFRFPRKTDLPVGYLLDGHQRLATLAGALIARDSNQVDDQEEDPGRWSLAWNMTVRRFQHVQIEASDEALFPLTALLDTLRFFKEVDRVRESADRLIADRYVEGVSEVARSFQQYRVPVIRIRQTGLSEAVEIFARLNSKGQAMSADQMVSALMYRQGAGDAFDLASEIDELADELGQRSFAEVDRTTVLRTILANLDEDIYRTDWTRLNLDRRDELLRRMKSGVRRTSKSLGCALDFLESIGVKTTRLLPYTLQLVHLSAFYDRQPEPSDQQVALLKRWFWVSSFSGWFGGANSSRVNTLISEFRRGIAEDSHPDRLISFDIEAKSLPYPATFDMRSARTRCLLLVLLSLGPRDELGLPIAEPWRNITEKGPSAVGHVFTNLPRDIAGNPANRVLRPPGAERGALRHWVSKMASIDAREILESYGISQAAAEFVLRNDQRGFVGARQAYIIDREREFQARVGVAGSDVAIGGTQIDTE